MNAQKLLLIFVLLPFSIALCDAQEYKAAIVDTTRKWSVVGHTATGGPPPYNYSTDYFKFLSDTVLDLTTYRKIYVTDDPVQSNWSLMGFIREDVDQKVYYRGIADTAEGLLYDFQVAPGDTVHIVNGLGMATDMTVVSIDSTFIYDRYHKRISFGFETWVEGLGSSCGILFSGAGLLTGYQYELLCYLESDTVKYSNPLYSECYIDTTIVGVNEGEAREGPVVNFYPNPTATSFSIQLPTNFGTLEKLEIFNCVGQLMGRYKSTENIDVSGYPRGVYFVVVTNTMGERIRGNVVKE